MSENIKRLLTLLLAASMVFSMIPMGVSAETATAEPSAQGAAVVDTQELTVDTPLDAAILEEGAEAWFSFTPEEDGIYQFVAVSELDTDGTLYNADMEQLIYMDCYADDTDFVITQYLTAGEVYYLCVTTFNGRTGEFQLQAKNASATATALELEAIQQAQIEQAAWDTWFCFIPEESGTYQFTSVSDRDPYCMLYDANMGELLYNDNAHAGTTDFEIVYDLQAGNTYYLAVNMWGSRPDTFQIQAVQQSKAAAAGPEETVEEVPLQLGTTYDVQITEAGQEVRFAFVPEHDGVHFFYGSSDADTTGTLYNEEGIVAESISGYENCTFRIHYNLEAGNTYYFGTRYNDGGTTGTYQVWVERSVLQSLEFEPVTVVEYTCGQLTADYDYELDEYSPEYWNYNAWQLLEKSSYTATFIDGTVITPDSEDAYYDGFYYNGEWYSFGYEAVQSYENQWTVDGTYYMTLSTLLGHHVSIPVTVVPSPLESITFTPISVIEETIGHLAHDYNEDTGNFDLAYWNYNVWELEQKTSYTANFSDGTVITPETEGASTGGFYYDGEWYDIQYSADQSYTNPWTAGSTYAMKVSVMGKTVEVPVTVEETPLQSLVFTPVTVIEKTCGEMTYDYIEETGEDSPQYWCFSKWQLMDKSSYTATFSDGTVITRGDENTQSDGFYYDGEWYYFDFRAEQSYENQWTVGNTYTMPVTVLGKTAEVSVTVEETPLQSLVFTPVSVIENTTGSLTSDYDNETDGNTPEYWYYNSGDLLYKSTYTATFNDGTVITPDSEGASYDGFYYEDEWYSFNYQTDQSYENQWTVGTAYAMTVTVMGKTWELPVTIAENPLQSIVFAPVSITENTCGYFTWDYDDETDGDTPEYWRYEDWQILQKSSYVATFSDGTVITKDSEDADYDRFCYDGEWYWFEYQSNQSYENQWTVGSTYTMPVTVLGKTVEVSVTVEEPPLQSLVFTPVSVTENTHGYFTTDYDEETDGNTPEYWRYEGWRILEKSSYVATFSDGTVITPETEGASYDGFYYEDEWYSFNRLQTDQSYENQWTVGTAYAMTVTVMGKTWELPVTIAENPLQSIVFTPVSVTENTHGYFTWDYDDETDGNTPEYWCYEDWRILEKSSYVATFSDGTVITQDSEDADYDGFCYDGEWYWFEYQSNQSYENQWTVGSTYTMPVTVMGKSAEISVAITPSPLESIVFEPLFVEENTLGYSTTDYDDETGGRTPEYWHYTDWKLLERCDYVATFSDGTVITPDSEDAYYDGFWYDGEWYWFEYSTNQNYENRWLADNTYTLSVVVKGKKVEIPVTISGIKESDGYQYMVQNGVAVIRSCELTDEVLQIPEEMGGYPVTGIISLGEALYTAKEIVIPDSVFMLSEDLFCMDGWYDVCEVQKLTLGKGVANFEEIDLRSLTNLAQIEVSAQSEHYCSVDGVLYNKDCTVMVAYPPAKQSLHQIPDTVQNIDVIFDNMELYAGIQFKMGAGVKDYVEENGVIYDDEKTKVFWCTAAATGKYVMPETVEEIAPCAFAGSNLTEVTVSSGVTGIVYYAFAGSTKLEKVTIPDSVDYIGLAAFDGCTSLKSADIPASVNYIESSAYAGCTALNAVNITDLTAWCRIYFESADANPLTYAQNMYLNGSKITKLVIPETVTETVYGYGIGNYAFYNGSMTSATIPGTVKSIGDCAFSESAVKTVSLGEGLTDIAYGAFEGSALTKVKLPNSLTWMGGSAFAYCEKLASVTIGTGLSHIPYNAFRNTGLKKIVIPENIESIGAYAFADAKLTELTLNCEEVSLADGAFQYCPLGDLEFEDNVTYIGGEAFEGSLATIVKLPTSITEITYRSFAFSDNLVSVTIPSSVVSINDYAFEGDENLSHVLYTGTKTQWANIDCNSKELKAATIHYKATGNEVTTKKTCSAIKLYCSVCKKWETAAKLSGKCSYTAATCTAPKTCKVCGNTSGSALGHKYAAATCTKAKTCTVCKKTSGSALGHKYAAATCTKAKTCTVCKKTSGSALGHKYAAATCTKAKTCKVCKKTSGSALGHQYTTKVTKATTSKNGKIVKTCKVCKTVATTTVRYVKSFKLSTTSYTYNGKAKTPSVTVKDSAGKTLKNGTDYTVSYASGRKNVGTYKVTIKLKGNYSGTKTLTFKINPKAASINKLTAKSKALTVKLNRQLTQATGYQIQYSTSSKFTSAKTVSVTNYKTSSKTISGLKKGKKYYVRVRTYKTVKGVKYYSGWSAAKSMKTK